MSKNKVRQEMGVEAFELTNGSGFSIKKRDSGKLSLIMSNNRPDQTLMKTDTMIRDDAIRLRDALIEMYPICPIPPIHGKPIDMISDEVIKALEDAGVKVIKGQHDQA